MKCAQIFAKTAKTAKIRLSEYNAKKNISFIVERKYFRPKVKNGVASILDGVKNTIKQCLFLIWLTVVFLKKLTLSWNR